MRAPLVSMSVSVKPGMISMAVPWGCPLFVPAGPLPPPPCSFLLEVRDHLLAELADRVHHLLMPRRTDGAEHEDLFDPEHFIQFEKANALGRRTDAERGALL